MIENAYIVNGGKPLKGEVELSGAKNISLKVIIASLLFQAPVQLNNIPRLNDIEELMHLIRLIGGKAEFTGQNEVIIDGSTVSKNKIDLLHGSKVRVSAMFFAPLLQKFHEAYVPNPGGCRIGARSIDRLIDALKNLGAKVTYNSKDGYYHAKAEKLIGTISKFQKPTHVGTEFAILLGCLAEGTTILQNVSLEPEIDDLIHFLNINGGEIKREGTEIRIEGVAKLVQTEPYRIENDRNEAVTYACFALATKGDITTKNISRKQIETFIQKVEEAGGGVEVKGKDIRFFYKGPLKSTDIVTRPHPGFMTDWQGPWAIVMTQAAGISTVHESVYEKRFSYVEELQKVGASIEFYKPEVKNPQEFYQFNYDEKMHKDALQGIKIKGPTHLHNGVLKVADLRAGATLLIAATVAEGESAIIGAGIVDRGYEDIVGKLTKLGVDIKKV